MPDTIEKPHPITDYVYPCEHCGGTGSRGAVGCRPCGGAGERVDYRAGGDR